MIATSTLFLWFFVYADFPDYLGSDNTQKITSLRTPSNVAYGEAFLNMPFKEDLTVADFIVQSPVEDYNELKVFLDSFFEDTEFEWYISVSSNKGEVPDTVFHRKKWKFPEGFDGYDEYLIPDYFNGGVIKVKMAFAKGIWIPEDEAEKWSRVAPSRGRIV